MLKSNVIGLIDTLAKGPGGVQINVVETGVTVSTRYHPLITCRGRTIWEAAIAVAIMLGKHPSCPKEIQWMVDEHEIYLRMLSGRP